MKTFHKLLERQVNKHLPTELQANPALQDFLITVNQSYLHIDDNRTLVERAMRLSSEELAVKNVQLLEDRERQKVLIESLKRAIVEVSPNFEVADGEELLGISDILHEAIQERKIVEKELVEARLIAEKAVHDRQVLMANVSHELRTPIHAIAGMASLLMGTALTSSQQTYASAISSSAQGLFSIINDLLDISKIESGKFGLENLPFSFDELLKYVEQSSFFSAEEKGLKLSVSREFPLTEWHIGDSVRIRQVLINLISNAIKFTNSGNVSVLVKITDSGFGNVDDFLIEVKDTGIGIEPENVSKIFEQFTQEDNSVSRRFGGTGLGLSITKTLVEMMGGTIEVRSEKGAGSCFTVSFRLPRTTAETSVDKDPGEPNFKGVRVLVVENNELNRFLALSMLRSWDAEAISASGGIEALYKLRDNTFDIVLMDIQMPGMDGLTVTSELRKEGNMLPVIALSASAASEDKLQAFEAGVTDYLSKPFTPLQLGSCMLKHLPVAGSSDPNNTPVLDLSKLLEMFSGNQEQVDRAVGIFSVQLMRDLSDFRGFLLSHDFDGIARICHRLVPSMILFGFTDLANTMKFIEGLCHAGNYDEILNPMESVIHDLEGLSVQISAYINGSL